MAEEDWVELPFEEAVAYLKGLRPVTRAFFDELELEVQACAFTVSGVTKIDVLQSMLNALNRAATDGLSLSQFVEDFKVTGLTEAHLATVYSTNLQSAYGAGLWDQGTNSDIADEIWGWRYHTVGDDRVREEHDALDGLTFQTGDDDELFPPWDYNCRCSAEWITNAEAQEEGLESSDLPGNVFQALGETDFTSPALGRDYEPDLNGVDLGLVQEYVSDQAE